MVALQHTDQSGHLPHFHLDKNEQWFWSTDPDIVESIIHEYDRDWNEAAWRDTDQSWCHDLVEYHTQ